MKLLIYYDRSPDWGLGEEVTTHRKKIAYYKIRRNWRALVNTAVKLRVP